MEKACCFTGYRPGKLPFKIEPGSVGFAKLESLIFDAVFTTLKEGITTYYCGMAEGFDLMCGRAIVEFKRSFPERGIRLVAVIPFNGQSERFSYAWKKLYDTVLAEADERVILNEEYTKNSFFERNRYMVDRSGTVMTYYDGKSGGTAYTLNYAVKASKRIINLCESKSIATQLEII